MKQLTICLIFLLLTISACSSENVNDNLSPTTTPEQSTEEKRPPIEININIDVDGIVSGIVSAFEDFVANVVLKIGAGLWDFTGERLGILGQIICCLLPIGGSAIAFFLERTGRR